MGRFVFGQFGCVIGFVLSMLGLFIIPLVVDKKIPALSAIGLSCKVGGKVFVQLLIFLILQSLLNLLGLVCCCVGLIFSIPVSLAAWVYAYEDIFGTKPAAGNEPIESSVSPVH
jgi:uncharacterized membrane protein